MGSLWGLLGISHGVSWVRLTNCFLFNSNMADAVREYITIRPPLKSEYTNK